jgi:hypothetical protein
VARSLRAVQPGDKPRAPRKPAAPKTVATAAASGSHRDLLVAMRSRIANAVSDPECPPRDLAALTRRLQDIAKEIESIDLRAKEEGADAASLHGDQAWDAEAL